MKAKTNTEKKKFDCIKMKNDIQSKIYEKIKKMTIEEKLVFFNSFKERVTFGI